MTTVRKEHSEVLKAKINIKYTNLNKYELQSKIGEGSFSYVYKIMDKKTSEIYAGKISIILQKIYQILMMSWRKTLKMKKKILIMILRRTPS